MFTGVLSLSPPPRPVFPVYKFTNSLPTYRRALLSERLEQAMKCQPRATSGNIVKEGLRSRALLPAK